MPKVAECARSFRKIVLIAGGLIATAIVGIAVRPAAAQVRGLGAGALVLDDYHGHTLIYQSPQPGDPGYSAWVATGPLSLHLPIPPANGAAMGFVAPGPDVLGPQQVLIWNPPADAGGTGGAQGEWIPESLSTLGMATASGTAGHLAGFTGTNSLGNTDLTGDVTTSGGMTTTISNTSAAGGHIISALSANAGTLTNNTSGTASNVTGVVGATNGGTGQNSYNTGDILVATAPNTLSRLPAGSAGQVLGLSGSTPAWINNSATITTNTNSASIATSQNDYTVDPSSTYIRISNTSATTLNITGISSTGVSGGRMITIANVSAANTESILITDHNPASNPNDQFDLPGATPILLGQKGAATFIYDGTLHNWELVSTN